MATIKLHGFVAVGMGQGTYMGWTATVVAQTEKAVRLRCTETNREVWLPKSVATLESDGERSITTRGVRLLRDAGFRGTHFYGDII